MHFDPMHPAVDRPAPSAARTSVTFSLIGPIRAWHGAAELNLGSPQQRTTLAVLLLHEGAVVAVEDLIAAVWADDPPRSAVTTIRTYVSRLRRVLDGCGVRIRSLGGGYAVPVPADCLDVVLFRRLTSSAGDALRHGDVTEAVGCLRSALALRHGPPLAGAIGPYAQGQRTRMEQLITAAEVDLVAAEIELGHHQAVLPELSAMVTEHPLWERLHELYMIALYRSGRQAEALGHYRQARRTLVDDLGLEPGARLRELHQLILIGERVPAAPGDHPAATITRRTVSRPWPPQRQACASRTERRPADR